MKGPEMWRGGFVRGFLLWVSLVASSRADSATVGPLAFTFGPGPVAAGYVRVGVDTTYSDAGGYGFEEGSIVSCLDRGGPDDLHRHVCTATSPFFFSVKVPEGNYRVDVVLGDPSGPSDTTVRAELRRLMVEGVHTESGTFRSCTFVVNVRTPALPGGGTVLLKPREKTGEFRDWDDRLTLEFDGERPCVCAVTLTRVQVPTLYLAGDSTVCDQPYEPFSSWGQVLPRFLSPGVAVANHAESGESLRSFMAENRVAKLDSLLKPGDTLMIQFGHNDQKEHGDQVGAFTTYQASLERLVADVRAHGATPILVTPVSRRSFGPDGILVNSLGDFPEAVRRVAREQKVILIDLNAASAELYSSVGPEGAKAFFPVVNGHREGTHHNDYGSYELAKWVASSLRTSGLPLASSVIDAIGFDPAHPDPAAHFAVPPSAQASREVPYGN